MQNTLQVKNVTLSDLSGKVMVEDLSFIINQNDKMAIIGEEGNGKSTLLKAIYNPKWIASYAKITGTIDMQFSLVSFLAQKLEDEWNACFLYEYLLKETIDEECDYNRYQRYEEICASIHIDNELLYKDQKMSSLSGGERVKMQIVKMLYHNPDLLLMDEPTNDIDLSTIEWLTRFIQESEQTIVFISHDIDLIDRCADVILHLEQRNKRNKPVWSLHYENYNTYANQRKESYEEDVRQTKKDKRAHMKKMDHMNDLKNKVTHAHNSVSRQTPAMGRLLKKKMRVVKGIERRMNEEDFSIDSYEESINLHLPETGYAAGKEILLFHQDVWIGQRLLVKDAKLEMYGKDKVALIGNNGTGKSVMLKSMYKQMKEKDLDVIMMPQNYDELLDYTKSPVQFILDETSLLLSDVQTLLGSIHLSIKEMSDPIEQLSEGQKAKVCLAYVIAKNPKVLLMDEPTRNISPLSKPVLVQLLENYTGALLLTTHDRYVLDTLDVTVYKIENQRLSKWHK